MIFFACSYATCTTNIHLGGENNAHVTEIHIDCLRAREGYFIYPNMVTIRFVLIF